MADIFVVLISHDPYFLFSARALLGRDRRTKIVHELRASTLKASSLADVMRQVLPHPHIVVIDCDSVTKNDAFISELRKFSLDYPTIKVLCLFEGASDWILRHCKDFHHYIHSLLLKNDINYYIHVAIHVVIEEDWFLVSRQVEEIIGLERPRTRSVRKGTLHPQIEYLQQNNDQVEDIVHRRIFVGQDNKDIEDELSLRGKNPVQYILSKVYKAFDLTNQKDKELELFDKLSEHCRIDRFSF